MNNILFTITAIILVCGAILTLIIATRLRATTGIPKGDIVSSDTSAEQRGKPLYSPRYRLTGTPDYLINTPQGPVPVEVKPTRTETEPRHSHLLQVLAYCLLIEETEGRKPPYGLLKYSANTFRVDYNEATRAHLLGVMQTMRETADLEQWQVNRNHNIPNRCRPCGYRDQCDQSLWPADK
ncbi:MAG: Dna2/Cas4 domain-containing protein [Chloroflexia bacterium]